MVSVRLLLSILHGYSDFPSVSIAGPETSQKHEQEPRTQHTITTSLDGSLISLILHAGHGVIKCTPCEQPLCSMCIMVLLMNPSMISHSTGVHVDCSTHGSATDVVTGCA